MPTTKKTGAKATATKKSAKKLNAEDLIQVINDPKAARSLMRTHGLTKKEIVSQSEELLVRLSRAIGNMNMV